MVAEEEADLDSEVVDRPGCRSGRSNVGEEVADLDGELDDLRTERRGFGLGFGLGRWRGNYLR